MAYKLLLADDSVTIQKVVELTFSDEDFEITAVGDGNAAFEKIKTVRPDIILSDVIMPGMNGYDLCAKVKQDPQLGRIPFLFLKGTFESFDEARAASVGSEGFIVKPFESQELIAKVKELVAKAREAPVVAPPPVVTAAPILTAPAPAPELEEQPSLGEFAEEPVPTGTVEGLESFSSDFTGFGEAAAEPAVAEVASEEDLWSEVKISDHPIPAAAAGAPAKAPAPEPALPVADQAMLEEVRPVPPPRFAPPPVAPPRPQPAAAPAPAAPPPAPRPVAAEPAAALPAAAVERLLAARVEEVLREIAPDIIREVARRVISDVVWEVVPDTAETLIRKEIDRITGGTTR